jgi:hypothetical protein
MLELKLKPTEIEITDKEEEFKDTAFSGADFKVYMRTLSSSERFNALKENTKIVKGKEETDFIGLNISLLEKSIVNWEGIGADGKEIKPTKENIRKVFEFSPDFAQLLLNAYNRKVAATDKKKQ